MWCDRLTQKNIAELPSCIEPARYQWLGSQTIHLNGYSDIAKGALLVGDGTERCQLNKNNDVFVPQIKNVERITLFNKAISTICGQPNNPDNVSKLFVADTPSPMLPAAVVDDESQLKSFEKKLLDVVAKGHLQHISTRPRIDIRYEEEVTDVARAKRLGKGSLVHLASHSENWQRQTLSGVVPKKVLARFSEDDYNIYENRVYVHLVDKIERYLKGRLSALDTLKTTLNEALAFYKSEGIDFRLSHDVCQLWGKTFDESATNEVSERLDETSETLKKLHKTIRALQQDGLYLMMSRNDRISAALHRTNILNHDPHYRHLIILWDQLGKTTVNVSPEEQFKKNHSLANAYFHYTGLVLQHALRPYLNDEKEGEWHCAGNTLALQQENLTWRLVSKAEDSPEDVLLTLIPWWSYVPVPKELQNLPENTFIVWPNMQEKTDDYDASCNNKFIPAYEGNWVALSPLDLYCVERLGLLIDQVLMQKILATFAKPIMKVPTKVLTLAKTIPQIKVDPKKHQLELKGKVSSTDVDKIKKALWEENAKEQAIELDRRHQVIVFLEKCPVCQSKTTVNFQKFGFKTHCRDCDSNRYLRTNNENVIFEQCYPKHTQESDFLLIGRRGFSLKIKQ